MSRLCPDGGTCLHKCEGHKCARRDELNCPPLSGSGLDSEWRPVVDGKSLFIGDPMNPYVARFMKVMSAVHHRSTALHVLNLMVKAQTPTWFADQILVELTKVITRTPDKHPKGPALSVIEGEKK